MSTESDAFDAFCTAVGTFAGQQSPALPVAYPGIAFTPPGTGTWLEVQFFPNTTQEYGTANDAPVMHQGLFQVSVCRRLGAGIVAALDTAAALVATFPKGSVIGPVRVQRKPWVNGTLEESDRTICPVTIPYRGFVA